MNTSIMNEFYIIGISVRTTNENNQVAKDIPALWERFMVEGIMDKIPNKIDATIYCLYTDYESDHTKPYTTILGCKVATIENVPDGMVAKHIEAGHYGEINLQGNLLLTYNLSDNGFGSVVINGSSLNAGMYIYSLVVNGQEAETKRMILTK